MARNASRLKLGYYPLVTAEAQRLRRLLGFPPECAVLDPCAGTGAALRQITGETQARRYGIELDSFRAMEARRVLDEVVQGSASDAHYPVESYSLLYLNPPYDHEIAEGRNRRTEGAFLEHCFRWLQPGGVLVLVIPGNRIASCSDAVVPGARSSAGYRISTRPWWHRATPQGWQSRSLTAIESRRPTVCASRFRKTKLDCSKPWSWSTG